MMKVVVSVENQYHVFEVRCSCPRLQGGTSGRERIGSHAAAFMQVCIRFLKQP
jgi:hypothetical protein